MSYIATENTLNGPNLNYALKICEEWPCETADDLGFYVEYLDSALF